MTIHHGDCVEVMAGMPEASIDDEVGDHDSHIAADEMVYACPECAVEMDTSTPDPRRPWAAWFEGFGS